MVLKNDDHSGELCRTINASKYSTHEDDGSSLSKNSFELKDASSQSGSLFALKSSQSILSENVESRTEARISYESFASKDIDMLEKLVSLETSVEDQPVSRPLLVSDWSRDQKGLGQDNYGSFINRRANDETEVFSSGREEDNKCRSCGHGAINCLDQGVEAVDSGTISGSPVPDYDTEERHLETRKHSQVSEATIQRVPLSSSYKCHGQDEETIQSTKATASDEKREPSLQTSPEDDIDESDVEEEDVKVCDTCGDAGREDLLAVCSRCSDGAEHTYCMREMLDKVPEGEWLCEECKCNEDLEPLKQEHSKVLGSNEKSKYLGRATSVNSDISFKLDHKDPFCERTKLKNVSLNKQVPFKRSGGSIEAGPTTKRQAFESSMSSPTTSSPSRMATVTKDCSFKNLDKTKGKPTNQCSTGTESTGDSSENACSHSTSSLHVLKGNFVKSNSFSSSNSKTNVKVSEEVLHKQKQGIDGKDGPGKLIGKSMSFKGLGRSNMSEPKVKMLSPKCTPVQELKGQKQGRDRNSFERKNTIKSDHSFPCQVEANFSKRFSHGDNIPTSSVRNSHDYRNGQSDGKLTNLSKQTWHVVHKSSDAMSSSGEVKRLSSTNIGGSAFVNGTCSSAEGKPSHGGLKDGPTLNSFRTADRSRVSADGAKADVHDNQSEKALDNSFVPSKQGLNAGFVGGNRRGLSSDASILRTTDGIHENKLKAAIKAAMQKKQNISKNKIPENSNELSMSNTQGNHVGDAVLNQPTDSVSEEAVHGRDAALCNHISYSCEQTSISSAKQFKVHPAEFVISPVESVLTVSAIPEQESVWQGGFEIYRNGKLLDVNGGFQAYSSSFASAKVLEVVRKFPLKIVLNEVARSCAWPMQFKEIGVREDNIALYFFAKDLESYARSYKILLDHMVKHDLALRGNIDGLELLVFPSNHLPHKSQCWNTLFFMWGVFRGRRPHFRDDRSASLERPDITISNISPIDKASASATCLSEDLCLQRLAVKDLSLLGSGHTAVSISEAAVLDGSYIQQSCSLPNGDYYKQGSSVGRTGLSSPTSPHNVEKRPENHFPYLGAEACLQSRSATLNDHHQLDPNTIIDDEQSTQEIDRSNNLHETKMMVSDHVPDKEDISSLSTKVPLVGKREGGFVFNSEQQELYTIRNSIDKVKSENSLKQEEKCMDNVKNSGGQVKLENDVEQMENKDSMWKNDRSKKLEVGFKREVCVDINVSAESNMEDPQSLQCSPMRYLHEDSTEPTSQAASVLTCQKRPWMDKKNALEYGDEECIYKRTKGADGFSERDLYGVPSSFGDRFAAKMHDASTSLHMEDTSNEADNEKSNSVNPRSAERCFFLVDAHPAQSVQSGDHLSSWKVDLSGNEDRLPDGSPNLELALGVEKKQLRKGVLPFIAGIVDRKDPDRPPDIASSKDEDGNEDASASLSLSLAFPFSDKERPARPVERALPATAGHEVNTSLLLFRGSSGK